MCAAVKTSPWTNKSLYFKEIKTSQESGEDSETSALNRYVVLVELLSSGMHVLEYVVVDELTPTLKPYGRWSSLSD